MEVEREEAVIVAGDLNAHIGRDRTGYEEVIGGYGIGERNQEGVQLLQMCVQLNLKVWNAWFRKRDEHLITVKSGWDGYTDRLSYDMWTKFVCY